MAQQRLEQALDSTAAALADCYDRSVFLERLMVKAARLSEMEGLLDLLEQASKELCCRGIALYYQNQWVQSVPTWLVAYPPVEHKKIDRTYTLLGIPFARGWLAFWGKDFTAHELRIADAITQLVGAALESLEARRAQELARIEEHDRQLASQLWQQLVPSELPAPEGYQLHTYFQPARKVGGDFQLASQGWWLLGDVSGKGMPAAFYSGIFTAILPMALKTPDPAAALGEALAGSLERSEMFTTLVAVKLESSGLLRYLNLGHPPLLLRRSDGSIERLGAVAPPLGIFSLPRYTYPSVQMHPGDLLLCYSDGLMEAEREGELFGLERIEAVCSQEVCPQDLMHNLQNALEGWSITDDLSIQVFQYRGPHEGA